MSTAVLDRPVSSSFVNQQHALLVAYNRAKATGLTAEDAGKAIELPTSWRRVSELLSDQLIEQKVSRGLSVFRENESGLKARVMVITTKGKDQLKDWNKQ